MRTQIELGKVLKFIPKDTEFAFRVFLNANFECDENGIYKPTLVNERYPIGYDGIIQAIKDLRLLQSRLNAKFESWISIDLSPIDVSSTLSKMNTNHFKSTEAAIFDKSKLKDSLLYNTPIVYGVRIKKDKNHDYETFLRIAESKMKSFTEFEQTDSFVLLTNIEDDDLVCVNFFGLAQSFDLSDSIIELSYVKSERINAKERIMNLTKQVNSSIPSVSVVPSISVQDLINQKYGV